ncbi:hypothetical protein DES39_0404 [Orbus hercynius]|uniref:Lipoprotein n=1 Tax=Orbus hercynius TaxID=593135 RepID=A0A495RI45_9GAMM|nr:hypothetical protein [Orbus hercynius]RKS87187.1 hypothetical protein DES39_0404 [Orbus hercynius]
MFKLNHRIWLLAILLLTGCEDGKIKTILQTGLDKQDQTGKTGICFTVGDITYPYTSIAVTGELDESGYNRFIDRNNTLNKRLSTFAQLGLLTEQPVISEDGKPSGFYHYDITELGKAYRYYTGKQQLFCFGRVVVDSIKSKQEIVTYFDEIQVQVVYNRHVEGEIPVWATSPLLNDAGYRVPSKKGEAIDWNEGFFMQFFFRQKDNSLKPWPFIIPNTYGN